MLKTEQFIILVPRQLGHVRVKLELLRNLPNFDGTEELQTAAMLLSTRKYLSEGQEVILSTTELAIFTVQRAIKGGLISV